MAFALKAAAVGSASFSAAGPRRRAAATGRVAFRSAAPVVAVRAAAAAAAAVAEDKRSISGTFAELRQQGKVHSSTNPSFPSLFRKIGNQKKNKIKSRPVVGPYREGRAMGMGGVAD